MAVNPFAIGSGYTYPTKPGSTAVSPTLPGAFPFNYSPSSGGIPSVPNPTATQGQSLTGNIGNLGNIAALTQAINQMGLNFAGQQNQLNQQQAAANQAASQLFAKQQDLANQQLLRAQQEMYIPGLGGLEAQSSANTAAELAGQVPQGDINQLIQTAAQRGAGGGFGPSSPSTNAALMYALGNTAMGQQRQGQQDFSAAVGRVPSLPLYTAPFSAAPYSGAQPFNPASMLTTPSDLQQAQYAANLLNAAPVPAMAQQANLNALLQGLSRGQGATAPGAFQGMAPASSAQDSINQILQRYAGTATGQQPQAPTSGTGYGTATASSSEIPPGSIYNPATDTYDYAPENTMNPELYMGDTGSNAFEDYFPG